MLNCYTEDSWPDPVVVDNSKKEKKRALQKGSLPE